MPAAMPARLRAVPDGAPGAARPDRAGDPRPIASVSVLHAPSPSAMAPVVRLTRRGVVVFGLVVAALAIALVWVAALSAPAAAPVAPAGPAQVRVRSGDTLWSIASQVAPQRDPRVEIATLQRLNHLGSTQLTPGQTLRVR